MALLFVLGSALLCGWLTVQAGAWFPQRFPPQGCGSLFLGMWMLSWGAGMLLALLRRGGWRWSMGLARSLPAMLVTVGVLSIALSPLSTFGELAVYTLVLVLWLIMNKRR